MFSAVASTVLGLFAKNRKKSRKTRLTEGFWLAIVALPRKGV